MSISQTFNTMIKTYMPHELQMEELKARSYLWSRIKKDLNYDGSIAE
jgi:hypothetical protein